MSYVPSISLQHCFPCGNTNPQLAPGSPPLLLHLQRVFPVLLLKLLRPLAEGGDQRDVHVVQQLLLVGRLVSRLRRSLAQHLFLSKEQERTQKPKETNTPDGNGPICSTFSLNVETFCTMCCLEEISHTLSVGTSMFHLPNCSRLGGGGIC